MAKLRDSMAKLRDSMAKLRDFNAELRDFNAVLVAEPLVPTAPPGNGFGRRGFLPTGCAIRWL